MKKNYENVVIEVIEIFAEDITTAETSVNGTILGWEDIEL